MNKKETKSIILRPHEVRRLASAGEVQVWRAVKPQPTQSYASPCPDGLTWLFDDPESCSPCVAMTKRKCPFGRIGTTLWVREAWWQSGCATCGTIRYVADDPEASSPMQIKRPSTQMPRWASRFTVQVTAVRVARVQEIGKDGRKAADVVAAGIPDAAISRELEWFHPDDAPAWAFGKVWSSNNPRTPWASNPRAWVCGLKRVTT